jgi:vacuolar protein sorting-associated protein 13A/C
LKGVAGLVVKPVAGVLDVASKTAEGIKNTAGDLNFDTNRVRPPRPVYDINGIIKAYNEYDAQAIHFISMLKKGKYAHEKFIGQAMGTEWRGLKILAAVYLSIIILADILKKKIIWVVETHIIQRAEIQEKGVVLYTIPSRHKKTKGQTNFLIPFKERQPVESIYKKILHVLNRK